MRAVRASYLQLAQEKDWHVVDCGTRSIDDIHQELCDIVKL